MNAALIGAALIGAGLLLAIWVVPVIGYNTQERFAPEQPIPFSHKHHVSGLGIDCRYCHTKVELSSDAGMPSTAICMTCHSQVWTNAAMLAPDRESLAQNKPLRWSRVYTLPDYVFFDHSIHIAKGVGCASCHGPIDEMPLTYQENTLLMEWCLQCHRNPENHVRPKSEVFNMSWKTDDQVSLGRQLVEEYGVRSPRELTSCSTCHR